MPLTVDDDDATIKQVKGGRERATINIEREREREERKQTPIMMMTQQSKIKRDNY